MNPDRPSSLPSAAVVAAGIGMGVAGNGLLRAPGGPGLAFTLLFAGLAASVLLVFRLGERRLDPEARLLLGVGVAFGTLLLWRGSEMLRFLAFVTAAAAFALPALRAGRAWVGSARMLDVGESLVGAGLNSGLGAVRLLHPANRAEVGSDETRGSARGVARSVALGLLLAGVPLLVFGALFVSADPVFADLLSAATRIELDLLAEHVVITGILSWLACGYLAGFWSGTRLDVLRRQGWSRPSLRIGEVGVALGLVDLLFLAFVALQFRVLFGGAAWVEQTPGLTYAAYAREGFFQLVVATGLALPWLLAADELLGKRDAVADRVYRALAGLQLVLLLGIVASAAVRLTAYLDAYGLTEDRFVAAAVLGWLALLVVGFGATVLRGRHAAFTRGFLASGFILVAALQVANPAARSAADLLDRADPGAVDARTLASVGSDAVPVVVARIDELDAEARCVVARGLLSRWAGDRPSDWRDWNRADRRARAVVAQRAAELRALAGTADGDCPAGG